MKAEEIYSRLRGLAPLIVFSATRELDPTFEWDGDGPDPTDEGFDAYDITVTAQTIVHGHLIETHTYMGGSYYKEDEPLDDLGGYLPQMLKDVASDLSKLMPKVIGHHLPQLNAVAAFLSEEMKK